MDTAGPELRRQQARRTVDRVGKTEMEVVSLQSVKQHVTMPETGQPQEPRVPSASRLTSGSGSGSSRSLKLTVPDMEYESDSESVRCAPGAGVKGDGVEESSVDSGRGSRGSTPPVQEEEDDEGREEEDRARKNVSIPATSDCACSTHTHVHV